MISYDPAAQLLHVAPRTTADAWHALHVGAGLGVVVWGLIGLGAGWYLLAARRDVPRRHAVALGLWTAFLGAWALRACRYSPVSSGDELIDYAQSVLGVITGLRPVELIFPTGWTQLLSLALAPLVWLGMPTHAGPNDPQIATALAHALLDAAPLGLVLSRWLATAALIGLAVGMGRAVMMRSSAAAGIFAVGALLTSPHLQPLAASCSPHIPALALAWASVLLLALGDRRQRRWALGAGLTMGYAMGSHGLAALLLIASLPLWWRHRRAWWLGAAAVLAGVALSNPHLLDHWSAYAANLRFRLTEIGAAEAVMDAPVADYADKLLRAPLLLGGLVMWAVALPMERRLRRWDTLGPAAAGLVLLGLLLAVQTRFDRYLAWALPGLIWAAALGYGGVVRRLRSTKIDAVAAGALATACLALYAVPVASSPCPAGLDGETPLGEIAVRRSGGPLVLVTPVPQIGRAVASGLLAPALQTALLAEVTQRLGGRARVELRAFHLARSLPRSYVALPATETIIGAVTHAVEAAPAEVWELRWRRATPLSAPLHVAGLPPLPTRTRLARCGMLLRGAPLPANATRTSATSARRGPAPPDNGHRRFTAYTGSKHR